MRTSSHHLYRSACHHVKPLLQRQASAPQNAPFESQLRDAASKDTITPPAKGSKAATVATTEAAQSNGEGELEESLSDDFDSIDWARLLYHIKPLRTLKRKKSWVFKYGYRVALLRDPARTYWICKHCHQHKVHSFKPLKVTKSTTAAITHLAQV
jgi:hypothetical protein